MATTTRTAAKSSAQAAIADFQLRRYTLMRLNHLFAVRDSRSALLLVMTDDATMADPLNPAQAKYFALTEDAALTLADKLNAADAQR